MSVRSVHPLPSPSCYLLVTVSIKIIDILYSFFQAKSVNPMCIFYSSSTSPLGLTTFHVLQRHKEYVGQHRVKGQWACFRQGGQGQLIIEDVTSKRRPERSEGASQVNIQRRYNTKDKGSELGNQFGRTEKL